MRRLWLLLVPLMLLACERAPLAPAPEPNLNFANGPDQPSAVVIRHDGIPQGLSFSASGMRAYHGVDPRDICDGGGFYNDLWDMQVIDRPNDVAGDLLLSLGRNLITSVWPAGYGCAEFLSNEPLAEGTSHFQPLQQPHVFMWQAQGTLTRPGTGERVPYSGFTQLVCPVGSPCRGHGAIALGPGAGCETIETIAVNDWVLPLVAARVPGANSPVAHGQALFQGTPIIYGGGLVFGTSSADLVLGYDPRFGSSSIVQGPICVDRTGPYHHTVAAVEPAAPWTGSAGLRVTQESFAYRRAPDEGYVLLKYTFSNEGATPITDFYSGWVGDWDLLFDGNPNTDRVWYDGALELGEVTENDVSAYPAVFGIVPAGPSGGFSFRGWPNGSDPTSAGDYFGLLAGGVHLDVPTWPSDVRELMGLAPVTIPAGGSTVAYYALVGGATRAAFEANVAAARAKAADLGY